MCGIYGIYNLRAPLNLTEDQVRDRVNLLAHRGPNDCGVYLDKAVALGHRRLSIIDIRQGHQPMHNEDKTVWLICNGEIYNYRDLTKLLKSKGHRFYTECDSEVIVHLYEQYGEKCVEFLNGIFAFGIWDTRQQILLLARDRLGVKPLYYYDDSNRIIFASEIKAILADPDVIREVNPQALRHYLSLNYVPAPHTMFKKIHALLAGHILLKSNDLCKKIKYWKINMNPIPERNEQKLAEMLRDGLERAVERQMVSDVPIGAFLSGGIDSSVIVSLMAKAYPAKIKTFNVRFEEQSYDESRYASWIAKQFDTDHREIICRAEDYLAHVAKIIWQADNLTVDNSMLPLYLVSHLASQDVKVVLSGDGSDELFAGYPTYFADALLPIYQKLPRFLTQNVINKVIQRLPVSNHKMSFELKAKRFVDGARLNSEEAHCSWRIIFSEEEKKSLLAEDLFNHQMDKTFSVFEQHYQSISSIHGLAAHQYVDLNTWLTDSILAKVDSMSMANSLEVRVPFLDHELVEFSFRIPDYVKFRFFSQKFILKKAFAADVPNRILQRKKSGFNIPISQWLRGKLKSFMLDVLNSHSIQSIPFFQEAAIQQLIDEHLNSIKDNGYKLMSLLHFALWYDRFFRQSNLR